MVYWLPVNHAHAAIVELKENIIVTVLNSGSLTIEGGHEVQYSCTEFAVLYCQCLLTNISGKTI